MFPELEPYLNNQTCRWECVSLEDVLRVERAGELISGLEGALKNKRVAGVTLESGLRGVVMLKWVPASNLTGRA